MSGETVHDAACERVYTDGGFVFIDCLCGLRKAQAAAWDGALYHIEGHLPADIRRAAMKDNPCRVPSTSEGEGA